MSENGSYLVRNMKFLKYISFILICFLLQEAKAQTDTLVLYKNGPKYIISHSNPDVPLTECESFQMDGAYNQAAARAIENSWEKGKTYVWNVARGMRYEFKSDFTLKSSQANVDTIPTQKTVNKEVQLVKITSTKYVYVAVFLRQEAARGWLKISCSPTYDTLTVIKRYRVIIEDLPKPISPQLKVCNQGNPINLYKNMNDSVGTFSIIEKGGSVDKAMPLPDGIFSPINYTQGTYTVYYFKKYDNSVNPQFSSFEVTVGSLPMAFKATPNQILQGEYAMLEPIIGLPKGDSIQTIYWNYGDATPPSRKLKPNHYFLDSGSTRITLKIRTIQGCVQSLTDTSALFVLAVLPPVSTDANSPSPATYHSSTENHFWLSPNPSSGMFRLTTFLPLYSVQLSVYRVADGVLLSQQYFPQLQSVTIDLQNEGAGMYLCALRESNGKETKYKLVKQ